MIGNNLWQAHKRGRFSCAAALTERDSQGHVVACLLALITTLGPHCCCVCVQSHSVWPVRLKMISSCCRPDLSQQPKLGLLYQARVSSAPQLFRIMARICCAIRRAHSCLCSSWAKIRQRSSRRQKNGQSRHITVKSETQRKLRFYLISLRSSTLNQE